MATPCTKYKQHCSCPNPPLVNQTAPELVFPDQFLYAWRLYWPDNQNRYATLAQTRPSLDTPGVIPLRFARPC